MGYDPVLHERGAIPYGSREKLETYCYREIQQVEILVSIIGGRYGSQSEHQLYSISQQELKTAYDLGVQVFIFVESAVLGEYQTYLKNKDVPGVAFNYVDDSRVYRFLEEVHALPNNNPITAFGSAEEITIFLREQWAGIFQRFLKSQERQKEVQLVKDLQANMETLNQLVTYLTEEKQNSDAAIREILRSNHPAFGQLRTLLDVGYRVFFTSRTELSQWLKVARQYVPVKPDAWDSPQYEAWIKTTTGKPSKLLKLSKLVFDEQGNLVIYTAQQWDKEWISLVTHDDESQPEPDPSGLTDDDVPF
jgi:hypothetical protein